MELLSNKTNIDFMGLRWYAYIISLLLVAGSIYIWFEKGEARYGVDYKGGHEVVVKVGEGIDSEKLRETLTEAKFEDAVVQAFEIGSSQYSIRVGEEAEMGDSKAVRERLISTLNTAFPKQIEVLRTDYVGPTIGAELRRRGLIAVGLGLLAILGYISFRFELAFAVGAVVAIFHDVIVATGAYLLLGHALNGATLAAALTILGYSVNDTVVIFDRAREEIMHRKDFDLSELLNESLNLMLPRTLITHFLTLSSALALYFLGGGAIADLSLFLVVGMVAGSYSTIFIASPIVLAWHNMRSKKHAKVAMAA